MSKKDPDWAVLAAIGSWVLPIDKKNAFDKTTETALVFIARTKYLKKKS